MPGSLSGDTSDRRTSSSGVRSSWATWGMTDERKLANISAWAP